MTPDVLVMLDLRAAGEAPRDAAAYQRLWQDAERQLYGLDLRRRDRISLDVARTGRVDVWLVNADRCPSTVDASTTFAICGVFEKPKIIYRCATCTAAGVERYAPFICTTCGANDPALRVCDEHVVILDLNFQAVSCPRHVPSCTCGRTAVFWCAGAGCRRRQAWCEGHRRRHPGDPATSYCPSCYATRFPSCVSADCASTGSMGCEFTEQDRPCGTTTCPRHAYRWQIYGPHHRGLALCPNHYGRLPHLPRAELVGQILAGTAARRGGPGQRRLRLPRLSMMRHVFIHVRRELVTVPDLYDLITSAERRATGAGIRELVAEHRVGWQSEVDKFWETDRAGRQHFERLRQILLQSNRATIAAQVTYSEFQPHNKALWVRVAPEFAARFVGARGAVINELKQKLGLDIKLEKL